MGFNFKSALWSLPVIAATAYYFNYRKALTKSLDRLHSFNVIEKTLSYGTLHYIDQGDGEVILVSHGIFGGYDQGFQSTQSLSKQFRIIAPSRFGYLGSDIKNEGRPIDQSAAFKELLEHLKIQKAFILGTSAGGTIALKFALEYPEMLKGLILLSADLPDNEKLSKPTTYKGSPKAIINNHGMYLLSPFFKWTMGMPARTIHTMLPVVERYRGVVIDGTYVNTDYNNNPSEYSLEKISLPALLINAKDDKIVDYQKVKRNISRFNNAEFISIQNGGHLMQGQEELVEKAIIQFIRKNTQ